jgi:Fe-S oxidoreductase
MMLRQEYAKASITTPTVLMPQEFLLAEARLRELPKVAGAVSAKLLSHCTEATAQPGSVRQWAELFAAIGVKLETPPTGCCGMAGLFGHQQRHQTVSGTLFDRSWRRHVEQGSNLMATGFSCRCQSERLASRSLRHPLGMIAELLGVDEGIER